MKKLFPLFISFLILTTFPCTVLYAQDTTDTTTEDTTTETTTETEAETTDTTIDETTEDTTTEETTTDEITTTTEDETIGIEETTETDTTSQESTTTNSSTFSFLEDIDTMWLWVILGVGGVVLIGSLIGILSLSKKDDKEKKVKKSLEEEPTVETVEDIPSEPQTPIPSEPVPTVEPETQIPVTEPTTEVTQSTSIKDTLGNASIYQQDVSTDTEVAPEANVEQDLSDLNAATQDQTVEPQATSINTRPIETPVTETTEPLVNPTPPVVDIQPNATQQPDIQETVPSVNTDTTPIPDPMNIETPVTPPLTQNVDTNSTTPPQNPEQTLATENLDNGGLNQPVDTSGL